MYVYVAVWYGDSLANDAFTLIRVLYLLNEQYVRFASK